MRCDCEAQLCRFYTPAARILGVSGLVYNTRVHVSVSSACYMRARVCVTKNRSQLVSAVAIVSSKVGVAVRDKGVTSTHRHMNGQVCMQATHAAETTPRSLQKRSLRSYNYRDSSHEKQKRWIMSVE